MTAQRKSADAIEPEIVLRRILNALPGYTYRLTDENRVQQGIAEVLDLAQIPYEREHVAGADRFDFLCAGSVVIEAKIDGSLADALRQVARYCKHPFVEAVVIASSKHWVSGRDGYAPHAKHTITGKPVHVVRIRGRSF